MMRTVRVQGKVRVRVKFGGRCRGSKISHIYLHTCTHTHARGQGLFQVSKRHRRCARLAFSGAGGLRRLEVLVGGVLVAGHLHRGHVPLLGRRRWVEREACRSAGAASLSVASRGPSATHHDNAGDDDDEDRDAADCDAERNGAERLDRAAWLLHVRLTSRITMQSFRCCPLVAQFEYTFFRVAYSSSICANMTSSGITYHL